MKTLITLCLVSFLGVIASAQNNPAPAQPAQPAVTAPVQPVAAPAPAVQAAPVVAAPARQVTMGELRKKHIDAVAELKKKNIDEIMALKTSLKGKPQTEIHKAVADKKAEQETTVKNLEKANKAEIEQFKKEHPRPAQKELKK